MENKPFFGRVVVSKPKKSVQKENKFLEKNIEDIYVLEDVGNTSETWLKEYIGKEVKIHTSTIIKLCEKDEREYFLIPQEGLLAY